MVRVVRYAGGLAPVMMLSPVYSQPRRLLLIESEGLLEQNDDLVFQATAIFLGPFDESRVQRQRQPQAQILDLLVHLSFSHAGSVAKSSSPSQVRPRPWTSSIIFVRLITHLLRTT